MNSISPISAADDATVVADSSQAAVATIGAGLAARWQAIKAANPRLRPRDAARELGVSEADLVACQCGDNAVRLEAENWHHLIEEFATLGEVMSLTRNEHAVHETIGRFEGIKSHANMGMVLGDGIDLRLNYSDWTSCFAVTDAHPTLTRRSFQFYDRWGASQLKVYLTENSDLERYSELVAQYRSEDQATREAIVRTPPTAEHVNDRDVDVIALRTQWEQLTDTHDFLKLIRHFKVSRLQALRLAGTPLAHQVDLRSARQVLESCAGNEHPLMVFVSSPGVTQIFSGQITKLLETGPWFNVLDPGFNLHLRESGIASAWVVRKPTKAGWVNSLELFDASGELIALMFDDRQREADAEDAPLKPETTQWYWLLNGLVEASPDAASANSTLTNSTAAE